MNDGLTDSEAKAGDTILIVLVILFTSPWWLGFLYHTFRS